MRQQTNVVIEGYGYDLSQMGALEGRALVLLFVKLLGRIAPLMASLAKAASNGKKDDESGALKAESGALKALLDSDAVESIGAALNSVDAKELEPLWDAFARHAVVRGKDGKSRQNLSEVFDDHFAGEYTAMVKFFIESAKLNFGDFLGKALAQASKPPSTDPTP